jgi:hypothetical protein
MQENHTREYRKTERELERVCIGKKMGYAVKHIVTENSLSSEYWIREPRKLDLS